MSRLSYLSPFHCLEWSLWHIGGEIRGTLLLHMRYVHMPPHIISIVLASTRCKKMTSLSRLFMESRTITLHFPTAFGESPDTPKSNFQLIRMCSIVVNSQNAWRTLKHRLPMHVWQVPSIHCVYTDKIKLKQDKNQFSQEKSQNLSTEQGKVKAKVELLSHMASIISSTIN